MNLVWMAFSEMLPVVGQIPQKAADLKHCKLGSAPFQV